MQASAEFRIPEHYPTDKRGPLRWLWSHTIRQWAFILAAMVGAFGNAAMMAVVPILTGEAFNNVLSGNVDLKRLGQVAFLMAGSLVLRGLLQQGR